jgi:hypothetical protein
MREQTGATLLLGKHPRRFPHHTVTSNLAPRPKSLHHCRSTDGEPRQVKTAPNSCVSSTLPLTLLEDVICGQFFPEPAPSSTFRVSGGGGYTQIGTDRGHPRQNRPGGAKFIPHRRACATALARAHTVASAQRTCDRSAAASATCSVSSQRADSIRGAGSRHATLGRKPRSSAG